LVVGTAGKGELTGICASQAKGRSRKNTVTKRVRAFINLHGR
jgi:hypothetical protein